MTHFESLFSTETDYSNNIRKEEKHVHAFLSLGFVHFYGKKIIENFNSVVVSARARKIGKIVFVLTLTLIFPAFGQREKVNHLFKNIRLSPFKEI